MVTTGAGKLSRLKQAVEHHYEQLRTLRERREQFLRAAAGSLYPHAPPSLPGEYDILNLMRQAAEAQTLSLAANRPRIIAIAKTQERQAFAEHYKQALNVYAKTMRLEEALQECARNAFYSLGVAKVYMADSAAVELESDEWMDPGKPFVQSISPHHLAYDTEATNWQHCSFIADRYQVRFEDLVEDARFPKAVRDQIKVAGPKNTFANEDEWGESISGADSSRFEENIYLCDIFLPKDGTVLTYACDARFSIIGTPLKELDWDGSESGPYRFLDLGPIPDKTTPSSPAQNLLLQHNLVNSLYRKLERQAVRQKILNVGPVGDEDDARKIRDAADGEYVMLNNPDAIDQLRMDGPDQPVFGFTLNALEQFSKQAGNLDHKLGLSATADTAKQQGMIGQSVSRMEAFYQGKFVTFVREVVQELGRLLFEDATTKIDMTKKVEGTDFVVDAPWLGHVQEGARMGAFKDYDLDIEPYSMEYRSPQDRMAEMDAQVQMLIPLVPLLMQQGKMLDLQWYLKMRSEYSDLPEMDRLIIDIPKPPGEEKASGGSHERMLPSGQGGEYMHHSDGGAGGGPSGPDPMAMMATGGAQQGQ